MPRREFTPQQHKKAALASCFFVLRIPGKGTKSFPLETNDGSTRELKVVVGAVVKVNLVTGLQTKPKGSGVELYAAARIEHAIGIAITNRTDLIRKRAAGNGPAHAKVQQPALEYNEHAHRAAGRLKFRAKKSVDQPQVGTAGIGDAVGGDGCGLAAFKVVGHFAFQRDHGTNIEPHAAPHAEEIGFGKLQPGVIEKYAKLAMVSIILGPRGGRHNGEGQRQRGQNCETFHIEYFSHALIEGSQPLP